MYVTLMSYHAVCFVQNNYGTFIHTVSLILHLFAIFCILKNKASITALAAISKLVEVYRLTIFLLISCLDYFGHAPNAMLRHHPVYPHSDTHMTQNRLLGLSL